MTRPPYRIGSDRDTVNKPSCTILTWLPFPRFVSYDCAARRLKLKGEDLRRCCFTVVGCMQHDSQEEMLMNLLKDGNENETTGPDKSKSAKVRLEVVNIFVRLISP